MWKAFLKRLIIPNRIVVQFFSYNSLPRHTKQVFIKTIQNSIRKELKDLYIQLLNPSDEMVFPRKTLTKLYWNLIIFDIALRWYTWLLACLLNNSDREESKQSAKSEQGEESANETTLIAKSAKSAQCEDIADDYIEKKSEQCKESAGGETENNHPKTILRTRRLPSIMTRKFPHKNICRTFILS